MPDLARFLKDGSVTDYAPKWSFKLHVPPWAFKPDMWTLVFLRGLSRHAEENRDWDGLHVWELGVGTGINLKVLSSLTKAARYYFSDYDCRCVSLALKNLAADTEQLKRFHPLPGSWDLLNPPTRSNLEPPKVNILYGCLPQVTRHADLSVGDRRAHYYDPALYKEAKLNSLGLGLNEALLRRAKNVLPKKGQVILNLGGRPGLPKLRSLFTEAGFEPRVLWQETISQHMGTSLATLASLEEHAHHKEFEFFKDPDCTKPIGAIDAEKRRLRGHSVFHKIYVICGTLT